MQEEPFGGGGVLFMQTYSGPIIPELTSVGILNEEGREIYNFNFAGMPFTVSLLGGTPT